MKALISFNSYPTFEHKAIAFQLMVAICDYYSWNIQKYAPYTNIWFTDAASYILLDTDKKNADAGNGNETVDRTYDAFEQHAELIDFIAANSRQTTTLDGQIYSFDENGDVYLNKVKIPAEIFAQLSDERAKAMKPK